MTSAHIKLYQRVALTTDLPPYHLRQGDVAVVVEHLNAFSVSFRYVSS